MPSLWIIIAAPPPNPECQHPAFCVTALNDCKFPRCKRICHVSVCRLTPSPSPPLAGAAKAVALVLPNLKGKLNGFALRVPTPNVSIVDLVIQVEKKTFAEEVNGAFREAAAGEMNGVLAVSDAPLVSVDFRCTDVSTTIDSSLTMVMGDDMVKVRTNLQALLAFKRLLQFRLLQFSLTHCAHR